VTGAGAIGHVVVPELPRALVAGAGATGHVAVLELPVPRDGSRGHRACGGPGAAVGLGGGSWSHEACGGSEAALCPEMGTAGDARMCARLAFHL
jgi:hypothetical protein